MIAECTREFRDLEAGVVRRVGDAFEVTPERLEAINGTKYGALAKAVEDGAEKAPQSAPDGASAEQGEPKTRARRTRRPKNSEE